jgi:hypothetical protein
MLSLILLPKYPPGRQGRHTDEDVSPVMFCSPHTVVAAVLPGVAHRLDANLPPFWGAQPIRTQPSSPRQRRRSTQRRACACCSSSSSSNPLSPRRSRLSLWAAYRAILHTLPASQRNQTSSAVIRPARARAVAARIKEQVEASDVAPLASFGRPSLALRRTSFSRTSPRPRFCYVAPSYLSC